MFAAISAGAIIATGASASAVRADTFVAPPPAGDDTNDCTNAGTPCATITEGINQAGTNDTIHVGEGTYPEAVSLGNGKSLLASGSLASTIITSPSIQPAITVSSAAGTIEGFTIRGPTSSVAQLRLDGPATVQGNRFDGDAPDNVVDLWVNFDSGSSSVTQNTFEDPAPTDTQTAITLNSPNQPTIATIRSPGSSTRSRSIALGRERRSPTTRSSAPITRPRSEARSPCPPRAAT